MADSARLEGRHRAKPERGRYMYREVNDMLNFLQDKLDELRRYL
jgi:hypothetical protein